MKRSEVENARQAALSQLQEAGIALAKDEEIEVTDFGRNDYRRLGLALVVRVQEPEYASKWLTVLPGQVCPNHRHEQIKETFIIIRGDVELRMGADTVSMRAGDKVPMAPGPWHEFTSGGGAVIEEITTRQVRDDSWFEDPLVRRFATLEDD
jgi:D-lyxose ketol-isomerase